MPFPILIGTTLTTVLHYRADCDHPLLQFADITDPLQAVADENYSVLSAIEYHCRYTTAILSGS